MEVKLARSAGFCMGVRRAVEITLDMLNKEDRDIATFGPLIHNPQVLDLLHERGVKILKKIPERFDGTVVLRAHGVPPAKKEALQKTGAHIKDATCPRVVKVQVIIDKYRKRGYQTIIIGDRNHAEVEGLMGHAGEGCWVVSNEDDVEELIVKGDYIIVSQTTQDENSFERISRMILDRFPQGRIFNTICDSTHKRQEEVRALCKEVQAMVIVGGRTSANTARLGEIAKGMGCPVFMIETEDDLDLEGLSQYTCVGVTAGASTPTWMINWIVRVLQSIPSENEGVLLPFVTRIFWLLLATNLYVGLAGGVMANTCAQLLGLRPDFEYFAVAFGYIFAMHNINRFTDQRSKKINDPMRALFYRKYRIPLVFSSVFALGCSLFIAYGMGEYPFTVLIAMSVFGILYSVRFIPKFFSPITRVRGLKEIPGSKTFLVALAWAFVTALIPAWSVQSITSGKTLTVFFVVLLLYNVRNGLFDVFEVQGDRLVGKETLPVLIGEKKTLTYLYVLLGCLVALLLITPVIGLLAPLAYWLLPGVIYLFGIIRLYEKAYFAPGPVLEFLLESVFFVIAGLAWAGSF